MKAIDFHNVSSPHYIRLISPSGKPLLSLQVGQVLEGKIVNVMDEGHAVLHLEGYDFTVESQTPLQKNMEGAFQVTSLSPQIVLKLLPPNTNRLEGIEKKMIYSLRPDPLMDKLSETLSTFLASERAGPFFPLRETLEHLVKLWTSFSPSSSFKFEPEQIAKMILQSGLFFESRLRGMIDSHSSRTLHEVVHQDLKGLSLKLKAEIKALEALSESPQKLKDIEEMMDLLLGKIEGHQQLTSSYVRGMEEKISLLLPFWMEGRLQLVDLLLSLPSREPEPSERRKFSMLFLLHFSEWGRVSIDVQLMGRRFYGQFFFSSDQVASFFNQELEDLQRRLCQLGFQPEMHVSTRPSEKILEQFISEVKGNHRSLLDLLV